MTASYETVSAVLELPPLCGRDGSFPLLPCRDPTSSPLMWLRCIAASHFIMSLLITCPVLGNTVWWPSRQCCRGLWGDGRAYIWYCYAVNEPEMLDVIKSWLGMSQLVITFTWYNTTQLCSSTALSMPLWDTELLTVWYHDLKTKLHRQNPLRKHLEEKALNVLPLCLQVRTAVARGIMFVGSPSVRCTLVNMISQGHLERFFYLFFSNSAQMLTWI